MATNDIFEKYVWWPNNTNIVPATTSPFQEFSYQEEAWDNGECHFDMMIVSTQQRVFQNSALVFW
jgi:hypothetical protein